MRSVTDFGAVPDDDLDDTAAIQRAFDAMQPGEWLRFPPGRYLHAKSLWLRTPGVVLWGDGATLHATNPDDQAVLLAADRTAMLDFRLTAVTDRRRTAPWHARIAIFERVDRTVPLEGNVVMGNRIENDGPPGSATANGASAAGIFVYRARHFTIADNTIVRTLADGIHVTAGSSDGRVVHNRVRETGDDMIGLVSYLGDGAWTDRSIDDEVRNLARRDALVVRDIVVAGNDLSGQYWGRGIAVVGGERISILDNTIARTTHGAAIYLAREPSYLTFGVRDIRVEHNAIRDVQTTEPAYRPDDVARMKTRHAAVEIYARLFRDEAASTQLEPALRVERIAVEHNTIDGVIADGIRIGLRPEPGVPMLGRDARGRPIVRAMTAGTVRDIGVDDNRISHLPPEGMAVRRIDAPASSQPRSASAVALGASQCATMRAASRQ